MVIPKTKKCNKCGLTKELISFDIDSRLKDGVRSYCKLCRVEGNKNYFKKYASINKEKINSQCKIWRSNNKEKARELTDKWKMNNQGRLKEIRHESKNGWLSYLKERGLDKCSRCGYDKCFAAIEYHHVDASTKKTVMGVLMNTKITPIRIEELNKTIPLCANCHREVHFLEKK